MPSLLCSVAWETSAAVTNYNSNKLQQVYMLYINVGRRIWWVIGLEYSPRLSYAVFSFDLTFSIGPPLRYSKWKSDTHGSLKHRSNDHKSRLKVSIGIMNIFQIQTLTSQSMCLKSPISYSTTGPSGNVAVKPALPFPVGYRGLNRLLDFGCCENDDSTIKQFRPYWD